MTFDRPRRQRVALFCNDLLPISQTFIRDQAGELRNWEPILTGFREISEGLATPGIDRELLPTPSRQQFWFNRPSPGIVHSLTSLDVALVHAHFGTCATDIWPSVKAAGLPMLVTLHGYDINIHRWWWEQGHGGLRRRVYPSRLLKMAQDPTVHFIAVSMAIQERAIEYGIPAEKIAVSYIGVDTERFNLGKFPLDQRRKRILFTGRMVEKKAPSLMVRAYAKVLQSVPDAELVMIGDGPLLEDAKHLASILNAPVMFLGARYSDEVLTQLHEARVFCLPSITAQNGDAEGFGLVILEAQATGVPVVSSAKGGAYEGLLEGETGYRFPEGNVDECATYIISILSGALDASAMSLATRSFVEKNFSIAHLSVDLERIYQKKTEARHESKTY